MERTTRDVLRGFALPASTNLACFVVCLSFALFRRSDFGVVTYPIALLQGIWFFLHPERHAGPNHTSFRAGQWIAAVVTLLLQGANVLIALRSLGT
ncbi:MAG: hypothetical protein U1F29_10605 [Planctomycetota bacterium]